MNSASFVLAVLLTLMAQVPTPPEQGKPQEFTGAIGSFRAELSASTDNVEVEQPFTLTVRIRARPGKPVHQPPGRPDLRLIESYITSFHITPTATPVRVVGENVWEFDYQLKPKSVEITEIPDLPFYYFDPAADAKRYQKTFADGLPLLVTPPPTHTEPTTTTPLPTGPESLYALAPAERVTAHTAPLLFPTWWQAVLGALLPPLISLLAYWIWQRRHPDAVRRAAIRRSRAARDALHALRHCATIDPLEQVLTDFLHQRFDLAVAAPTPVEVMRHLMHTGVTLETIQRTGNLYRTFAAARFGATPVGYALEEQVKELIIILENEACRVALSY